jgi:hypothetical protein
LAAKNYEEVWSRIDGEELAMAANSGSRMKRKRRRIEKLMEEAKGLSKELGSIKGSRREEGERWW